MSLAIAPVGSPGSPTATTVPVAGQLYEAVYYPTLNGASVDVTTVDKIELFTTSARTGTPTLTINGPATRTALGTYKFAPYVMPAAGIYYATVTFTVGAQSLTDTNDTFTVYAFDGSLVVGAPVTVAEVKLRLNKTTAADDVELQSMLDAALAEYAEWVGPLPGSKTARLDGGSDLLILPLGSTAVTTAAYSDGTAITLTDLLLDTDTAILHWSYGTSGSFATGSRNVVLTVTIGSLPANHREAILADVAGYFAATQRGGQRSALPAEGYAAGFGEERSTPLTLWPRIRALAPVRIG